MNAAVIVAAGRGTRMGLERNKVLAPLCGEPVIARTVRAFEQTGWFDGGIVVVTGACDADEMKRILADGGLHAQVVLGGADRQRASAADWRRQILRRLRGDSRRRAPAGDGGRHCADAGKRAEVWQRRGRGRAQGYGEAR